MFHLAVVLEERNVVDCCLDTQHLAEFVVNLDAGRTHAVLDAASLDAGGLARANLLRQRRRDLLAQKASHPGCIGRKHRLELALAYLRLDFDQEVVVAGQWGVWCLIGAQCGGHGCWVRISMSYSICS